MALSVDRSHDYRTHTCALIKNVNGGQTSSSYSCIRLRIIYWPVREMIGPNSYGFEATALRAAPSSQLRVAMQLKSDHEDSQMHVKTI